MTRLKELGQWLKDFGTGVADDEEKAHHFYGDEAYALAHLYPWYTAIDAFGDITLVLDEPPDFPAGIDMVWVRYNGCWLAAERQALFLGTQAALRTHRASKGAA